MNLSAIYDRYFPLLFSYALRFSPDREQVKAVLQDLFTELFRQRAELLRAKNLHYFLISSLRKRLFKDLISEENYDFFLNIPGAPDPRRKEMIYLYFHEGMSYEEIAGILSIKEKEHVRTLIRNTITGIRNAYAVTG